jgi:hypothetical protein
VVAVLGVSGALSSGSDDTTTSTTTTGATSASANGGPQGFPLTSVQLDKSGNFQDTFAIRKALQPLLPRTQAVYVTLAKTQVVAGAIKQAVNSGQPILPVKGKTAFTGIVNSANAQKNVIPIQLRAGQGVHGTGAAALGVASANQPFFDLKLTGVKPAPKDSAYIVWFVVA